MKSNSRGTPSPTAGVDFLSVVMPAYNEADSIGRVILDHAELLREMEPVIRRWEIVVVNDGSTDATQNILESLAPRVPELRWVSQANQGICGAVTRGYKEARGSYIYSTGSDGQWPVENLRVMFAKLAEGADLVIGVRTNRRSVYSPLRRFISGGFNLIPPLLFGVRAGDAGSAKLGRRDPFQYDLVSRSPFFEAERIIRAHRDGLKIDYAPILFTTRTEGQATGASWRNVRDSLRDMARCVVTYGFR